MEAMLIGLLLSTLLGGLFSADTDDAVEDAPTAPADESGGDFMSF
jgi:hypothetical protein